MKSFKKIAIFLVLATITSIVWSTASAQNSKKDTTTKKATFQLEEGDILFQSGTSAQCVAVKLATKSQYSHCAIYLIGPDQKGYIYEAVQPVKKTPVDEWISHGTGQQYAVVRLKNAPQLLNDSTKKLLRTEAYKHVGKNYDLYFGWDNDKIYCSEYVWKIYKNALNIEVGELKKMSDFDLSSKEVKTIMKQRYGDKIPYTETVIAPSDIYNASNVHIVK